MKNLKPKTRIMVAMSGGVDSSVTALLLKRQGYDVQGLFMKNWEEDDTEEYCSASADVADAKAVCDRLDIPLHTVNFAAEYWEKVFELFLSEYQAGRTPNPDILCNKEIKFTAFWQQALNLGASMMATGHYAQCLPDNNQFQLVKGVDSNKDQSYFLYTLNQEQLSRVIFPIGQLEKTEVRRYAKEAGLDNHAKKDSTGICFIGERKFKSFLSRYIPAQPGAIETEEGKVIGEHSGVMYFTIGQRQGLQIGGRNDAEEMAWYVLKKDIQRNVLIVGQGHNHPALYSYELTAEQLHWIHGMPPASVQQTLDCSAKTRYRQTEQRCSLQIRNDGSCHVKFTEPQWAITPGQSIVFYQNNICLGGGIIQ